MIQAYPTATLITALALLTGALGGCGSPSIETRPPGAQATPTLPPATASASATAPASKHRVEKREIAVGNFHDAIFDEKTAVTLERGDRVLAMKAMGEGRFQLVGMAPGEALIRTVDPDGDTMELTVVVKDGRRPCGTRDVPVLGLVVIEETNVRIYRSPSNGAGELHVTATDSVVTFDRPGALLLMTETHDGVAQCTLYRSEPDPAVACKATVSVREGERRFVPLPKPDSTFVLTGSDVGTVEYAPKGLTFVPKKTGRAATWIRDPKGVWSCTLIEVAAS